MTGPSENTDVAVVGAGPAGLFAIFACGQLGMRVTVIDALPQPGGQCIALYPEKPIYDIPGRVQIRADRLIADLMSQIAPYDPRFLLNDEAETLEGQPGRFVIGTRSGKQVRAGAVILAAGPGRIVPKRPPLPGIAAFEGHSVHYHVARRDAYAGRHVVIAGGGDSAVDWALSLAGVAASVTVVHRRETFRAAPSEVAAMRADRRIALRTGWQLAGLDGAAPVLDGVIIRALDGTTERLRADVLIPLFGLSSDLGALSGWGLTIERGAVQVKPANGETGRPGVFAIGDMATYPGKRKLILTGFAEGAAAAVAAHAHVFPGQPFEHQHSTSRGAPGAPMPERVAG